MFRSKSESNVVYKCTVQLLEDSDVLECEFQPNHKGKFLVDYVCEQLEIAERDYFGLRFVDNTKQRHWLDLAKNILKQVKDVDPVVFSLRIKFYPAEPLRLTGYGKVLIYQQIKRDLIHGRLYCSAGEAAALGALIVQEELGDYDPDVHHDDYVKQVRFSLRQSDVLERKVMELHQKREPVADQLRIIYDEFMTIARGLETYGVDPHPVKDHRGTQLYLGINYSGICTIAAGRRAQHFRWSEVHKLNFEGKMFIAHLSYTDASREPKKHTIGFKCSTGAACRYVWRCAIEQMLFFTLPNNHSSNVMMTGGGFFSWGAKFRYTGRTEREILSENISALKAERLANSSPSKRKANSVPATPSSPQGDLAEMRYSSLPRSTMSEPHGGCLDAMMMTYGAAATGGESGIPLLETVSEESRHNNNNNSKSGGGGGAAGEPSDVLMSDYYTFRDSFEHSSSESGFTNLTDTRIGMKAAVVNGGVVVGAVGSNHLGSCSSHINNNNKVNSNLRTTGLQQQQQQESATGNINGKGGRSRLSLVRVFVPSFVLTLGLLFVGVILIIESEAEFFKGIKQWPEMVELRQHYEPIKKMVAGLVVRKGREGE